MSSLSTPLNNTLPSPQRHAPNEQQESTSPLKQQPLQPQQAYACNQLSQDLYAQMFKQLDNEAFATLVTAILITMLFWLAIFLTSDCGVNFLHMPLWFVLSCLGGYILSVVGVIVLVKCFLKDMPLHPTSHASAENQELTLEQEQTTAQAQTQTTAADHTIIASATADPTTVAASVDPTALDTAAMATADIDTAATATAAATTVQPLDPTSAAPRH